VGWTIFTAIDLFVGAFLIDMMSTTVSPEKLPQLRRARKLTLILFGISVLVCAYRLHERTAGFEPTLWSVILREFTAMKSATSSWPTERIFLAAVRGVRQKFAVAGAKVHISPPFWPRRLLRFSYGGFCSTLSAWE